MNHLISRHTLRKEQFIGRNQLWIHLRRFSVKAIPVGVYRTTVAIHACRAAIEQPILLLVPLRSLQTVTPKSLPQISSSSIPYHGSNLFPCHLMLLQIKFEFFLNHHVCHLDAFGTIKRGKGSLIFSVAVLFRFFFLLFQGLDSFFRGSVLVWGLFLVSKKFSVHFFFS